MSTLREAAQMALDRLNGEDDQLPLWRIADALRAALAEPAPTGELPPLPDPAMTIGINDNEQGFFLTSQMRAYAQAALAAQPALCRTDGRCQYAIDHGAEGLGHCPAGKCSMPAVQSAAAETCTQTADNPAPSVPNWPRLYEDLRAIIDGGSESMTHADAVEMVRQWAGMPPIEFEVYVCGDSTCDCSPDDPHKVQRDKA